MKVIKISISFIIVSILAAIIFSNINQVSKTRVHKIPKEERIQGRFEHEFEKTVDPATGTIPKERLFLAKQQLEQIYANKNSQFEVHWEERGPSRVGGRTRALLFDVRDTTGNTVYAGAVGGGLWKNENIKSLDPEWTMIEGVFENIAISAISQQTTDPNILFIGTGEGYGNSDAIRGMGFWRSMDGGITWEIPSGAVNIGFEYIYKTLVDDAGIVYVASKKGLYASDDNGDSWTYLLGSNRVAESNSIIDLEIGPDGTMYASAGFRDENGQSETDGLYKRMPGQSTFSKLNFDLGAFQYRRVEVAISPSDPNRIYALVAASSGACEYILRSDNKGSTWQEMTVPGAIGMGNFARNQAWFDLEVAVDPLNEDRIFIGGIDLHLSEDGGQSWRQISQWFGRESQYVHADQHRMIFNPFNPKEALFGNDGGVFYCEDIGLSDPIILSRVFGYNVTQFYSGAMHPNNDDLFLGGTQDNGTYIFESDGINAGRRVSGGDGAFCHIDQNDPNIMITSYVYNSFFFSIDGGNSFTRKTYEQSGSFINPTEYNSDTKTLFANYRGGQYLKVSNIDILNTSEDIINVREFNSGGINSLKLSPNLDDRVYFGLDNGTIVYVDSASTIIDTVDGIQISSELVNRGYMSSLDIAEGDENHIIASFSNYGIESVWETIDGGENWVNIEGNLPDMPIRWVMFSPNNDNSIIAGTEMGVWITTNLAGGETKWFPSNTGLAITRVNMLKRNNNGTVLAATHGRGVFTTTSFQEVNASFVEDNSFYFTPKYLVDACDEPYEIIRIPVVLSNLPENEITVTASGFENWPEQYQLLNESLLFSKIDGENKKYFEVKVPLNNLIEQNDKISFEMLSSSDFGLGAVTEHTISLVKKFNDDEGFAFYQTDTMPVSSTNFISDKDFGSRTQIVISAEELHAMGIGAGLIRAIDLYSLNNNEAKDSVEILLKIGEFRFDDLPFGFPFARGLGAPVYNGNFSFKKGINTFDFEQPYLWDGTSNLVLQFCIRNSFDAAKIDLVCLEKDRNTMSRKSLKLKDEDPCGFFTPVEYWDKQAVVGIHGQIIVADSSIVESVLASEGIPSLLTNADFQILGFVQAEMDTSYCVTFEIQSRPEELSYDFIDGRTTTKEFHITSPGGMVEPAFGVFYKGSDVADFDLSIEELNVLVCHTEFATATMEDCSFIEVEISLLEGSSDSAFVLLFESNEPNLYITLTDGLFVSVDEPLDREFNIYPVPFASSINVEAAVKGQIELFDVSGRKLYSNGFNNSHTINTNEYNNGVYWVVIKYGDEKFIRKIIK